MANFMTLILTFLLEDLRKITKHISEGSRCVPAEGTSLVHFRSSLLIDPTSLVSPKRLARMHRWYFGYLIGLFVDLFQI